MGKYKLTYLYRHIELIRDQCKDKAKRPDTAQTTQLSYAYNDIANKLERLLNDVDKL
jgi:hypothetical protein